MVFIINTIKEEANLEIIDKNERQNKEYTLFNGD